MPVGHAVRSGRRPLKGVVLDYSLEMSIIHAWHVFTCLDFMSTETDMYMALKEPTKSNVPLYKMVRQHVLGLIEHQELAEGGRLPSEKELVDALNVSRMTVNRAFRELAREGYVERIAGVGTFAIEKKAQSHPLEIHSIAEEISLRGHSHESKVITLEEVRATAEEALLFDIKPGARLFHSVIIHNESGAPIQVEERHILPQFAPDYLEADFNKITPTDYLLDISSSISEVEQIVQAAMAEARIQKLLDMKKNEPCLVLLRRTWVENMVVTRSVMHHPSQRFQFGGRFKLSEI